MFFLKEALGGGQNYFNSSKEGLVKWTYCAESHFGEFFKILGITRNPQRSKSIQNKKCKMPKGNDYP